MSQALDKVAAAARQLRVRKLELEAELRAKIEEQVGALKVSLDIAAAEAYRGGEKKTAIGRAMETKDYDTYNEAINRGEDYLGVQSENPPLEPNGSAFDFEWTSMTTIKIKNDVWEAYFLVVHDETTDDLVFAAETPLWHEDNKNPIVAALDMKSSGELYKEAVAFVNK